MTKKLNRKSWIIQRLRRVSMKWPPRNEAKKANRREYYKTRKDGSQYSKPNFEYQCKSCKEWFADKNTVMDHVQPVVSLEDHSKYTEEEFIGKFAISLLCWKDNFQILCEECHDSKTLLENKIRQENKKVLTKD